MIDITGKVCDSHPTPGEWPMYSFDRIAYTTLNFAANALHEKGWNENQIRDFFQSKQIRWAIDGGLFLDALENAGETLAKIGLSNASLYHKG